MTRRTILIVSPFVLCVGVYATAMSGYFLSDDLGLIFLLSSWQDNGEFWSRIFLKFFSGFDAPSHFYRPLTFLSFGLNLALSGLSPLPWHLVNLAVHLVAGIAVYRISCALHQDSAPSLAPIVSTGLFLLCGTNVEAVAWIAARADVLATAGLLWAAALYLQSRSGLDRYEIGALACGVLALASKESATVLPGLIACLAWIRRGPLPPAARWKAIGRDLIPWLLLIFGYFALRLAIFGSMLQVFPGEHPLQRLSDGSWLPTLTRFPAWLSTALPNAPILAVATGLTGILLVGGLLTILRRSDLQRSAIGIFAATIGSIAMLLPHLPGLAANGESGRFFYTATALAAILLGIPLNSLRLAYSRGQFSGLLAFTALALLGTHVLLLDAGLRSWRIAGTQMSQLVAALPDIKDLIRRDGYGFVVAPVAIGATPFARNANSALVLPPIQHEVLLRNMIVFLPDDIQKIPAMVQKQLIPGLKHFGSSSAPEKMKEEASPKSAPEIIWPTDMFCWEPVRSQLQRVELPQTWPDPSLWTQQVRNALHRAGCNYVP